MMFNYFGIYPFMPFLPEINMKPPTLYAILNSIVNYGKEEKTGTRNLAKKGRSKIFDFDYPLSNYVNKEDFEILILNHFMKRRIGYQTITDFKLHLEWKLNEIMPMYNLMFDTLSQYNIFEGERTIEDGTDNRTVDTTTKLTNKTNSSVQNNNDLRNSELPQSQIQNVKNASYMTDYTLEDRKTESEDKTTSDGTNNTKDDNISHKTTLHIKPEFMFEYMEKIKNINTLIFKELDSLFYQLI